MKKIVLILIMLTLTVTVFAQDSEDEQTIEELYLQNSVMSQIIAAEAGSPDRDMKLIAIQDLERMIEDGDVDPEDEFLLNILYNLGQEGITRQIRLQGAVMNDFPYVRKEACRLLGEIGGEIAQDFLIRILLSDPEPMVMSEAVYALAKCGLDEDDEQSAWAQRAMAASMYRQSATQQDNNFAVAYLNAVQLLADEGQVITDPLIYEEIVRVASPNSGYAIIVQKRAQELLRYLQAQM